MVTPMTGQRALIVVPDSFIQHQYAEAPAEVVRRRAAQSVRLGPGLKTWNGLVSEEYLTELSDWATWASIIQEMMDDAVIGALLDSIRTPLLSSEFALSPGGSDDADKVVHEFMEEELFNIPDVSWREHTEEALDFMAFGFSISEVVLEKRNKDGRLHLATLLPIGQETLYDWGKGRDRFGNVMEFRQSDPITGKVQGAPLDKLLHFTFRSRKRNPQGHSLLRSLYRPWYFKKNLEVIEAIGAERDTGGSPVAMLDATTTTTTSDTKLAEALERFRMDEAAYLILPPGVKVEAYGGGGKAYRVRDIIKDWGHVIRQRFFADFISQGAEGVGTQALAKEATTFFSMILRSIQISMLEVWQKQLIRYILRFNTFDGKEPTLEWKPAGKANMQSLAQALTQLVTAKLLTPSREIEEHIRKVGGLPDLQGTAISETKQGQLPDDDKKVDKVPGVDNNAKLVEFAAQIQGSNEVRGKLEQFKQQVQSGAKKAANAALQVVITGEKLVKPLMVVIPLADIALRSVAEFEKRTNKAIAVELELEGFKPEKPGESISPTQQGALRGSKMTTNIVKMT